MQTKGNIFIKLILIICLAVILLITSLIVWYLFPIEKTHIWHFLPNHAISFISINIEKKNPFIKKAIHKIKAKIINKKTGFLKKTAINLAIPLALPNQVLFISTYDETAKKPDSVFIINLGRLTKLINIFSKPIDSQLFKTGYAVDKIKNHKIKYAEKPLILDIKTINLINIKHAYTIINNNLIIGTSLNIIQDTVNKYVNKQANKQGIENITTIMMPGASEKNSMVFLDNTKNHLTVLYKNIEEKVAFAAFPSIESINIIIGNISLAEPTIQLNFEFMAKNTKKLNDIRSDVKFTYGALKRVLKPRNIEMEYDLKTKDNFLFFNCKIKNLLNGLFDTENSN